MKKVSGIYFVIGMPYSGSTLLSSLMGTHSQVYGGADLHHLNPDRKGTCTIHKEKCEVFSPDVLQEVYTAYSDINLWYDTIAQATGRSHIFDCSKQVEFYKTRVLPEIDRDFVVVALQKHPMRALASDVYNRLFSKKEKVTTQEAALDYVSKNPEDFYKFVETRLATITKTLLERNALKPMFEQRAGYKNWVSVDYEDYMQDRAAACSGLLNEFGLQPEGDVDNYRETEQHPITGNMGVVWKIRGGDSARDYGEYRRNYYMQASDAFRMDNKYQDIFSADTIARIKQMEAYQKLLSLLNFEDV